MSTGEPREARTHWAAVLAALAAGVVAGAAIGRLSPALPLLQSEFGLSLIAAGWLASMFNTIAVASAIFFGLACDRAGALRFSLFGLACLIAGGALGAAAPAAAWIFGSRILEGAGLVAIAVAAPSLIAAASSPSQRGLALGLWGTYMPIGGAAAIAASPLLIALVGWRGLWATGVILALISAAFIGSQSRHYAGAKAGSRRSLANIRSSLAQPVPWLLGGAFAVYTLQFNIVMIWLPTYLLQTRATDATTAAMLTALFVFVNIFGNVTGSWLVHRNAPRGLVIGATFVLTTAAFVAMFSGGLADGWRYACVLAYGFVTGNIPPTVIAGGARYARAPGEAGSIQGLIVQCSNFGTFVGPPLVAAAVTHGGSWNAALYVILPAATLGLALAFAIWRLEARDPAGPAAAQRPAY